MFCAIDGKNAGTVPGCLRVLGGISQIRWLTHTGRQVPPSGLKPNSLTRGSSSDAPQPIHTRQRPRAKGSQDVRFGLQWSLVQDQQARRRWRSSFRH